MKLCHLHTSFKVTNSHTHKIRSVIYCKLLPQLKPNKKHETLQSIINNNIEHSCLCVTWQTDQQNK